MNLHLLLQASTSSQNLDLIVFIGLAIGWLFIGYSNNTPEPSSSASGYMQIWATLSRAQKKEFQACFSINSDEYPHSIVVFVRPLKKQYAFLNAKVDNTNSFLRLGKDLKRDIFYYTPDAVLSAVSGTSWYVATSDGEYKAILEYLPGKTQEEKVLNFMRLFELDASGEFNVADKRWNIPVEHESQVFIGISVVEKQAYLFSYNEQQQTGYVHSKSELDNSIALPALVARKVVGFF